MILFAARLRRAPFPKDGSFPGAPSARPSRDVRAENGRLATSTRKACTRTWGDHRRPARANPPRPYTGSGRARNHTVFRRIPFSAVHPRTPAREVDTHATSTQAGTRTRGDPLATSTRKADVPRRPRKRASTRGTIPSARPARIRLGQARTAETRPRAAAISRKGAIPCARPAGAVNRTGARSARRGPPWR